MKIYYTPHFLTKERIRRFPLEYSKKVYFRPDYKFFDNDPDNMSNISVRELQYGGVLRLIVIAHTYNRNKKSVIMKTIYAILPDQMDRWIRSGKWISR